MHQSECKLFTLIRQEHTTTGLSPEAEKDIWNQFGSRQAIMVVDSCGFTRISKDKGILHFLSCLLRARDIARKALESVGALDLRFEADNFYAHFYDPKAAVQAAFLLHREMEEAAIPVADDEVFRVCVGIGYGDVLRAGREGFFGDEMNLASKLGEDTAGARETLVSEAAYQALDQGTQKKFSPNKLVMSGLEIPYFHTDALS